MGSIAPAIYAFRLAGISPVASAFIIRTTMAVGRSIQPHLLGVIGQSQSQSQDSFHTAARHGYQLGTSIVDWYVKN